MSKRALRAAVLAVLATPFAAFSVPAPIEAGTSLRLDIEDLVREADLVFEGRVLAARAFRDLRGLVCTEFTVSVHATYWGESRGTQQFTLPGGVMPDGSGTVIPGMATLAVGEDALLFLAAQSRNGWRSTVGLAQGKFEIVRDDRGQLALTRRAADLVLVDPRTRAAEPASGATQLPYAAVVARVQVAAGARRAARLPEGR